jgi:hypothetical protein
MATGTNAPSAIAIPPTRGMGSVWIFRPPGRSTIFSRSASGWRSGIVPTVRKIESSRV